MHRLRDSRVSRRYYVRKKRASTDQRSKAYSGHRDAAAACQTVGGSIGCARTMIKKEERERPVATSAWSLPVRRKERESLRGGCRFVPHGQKVRVLLY